MGKIGKRLLVFFIGIPCILAIVFCNVLYNLPLQILIAFISVIAANEFYDMLSNKYKTYKRSIILICTALLPYLSYIFILADIDLNIIMWIFIFEIVILMAIESFFSQSFENSIVKISTAILIIFYCGYLITFMCRMTLLENSIYYIALFLIFVFMCDSAAWFFGILFGNGTRGYFKSSPNKSIVGFFGGILGSIASGLIFTYFFKDIFNAKIITIIILGLFTSLAAIIGDLIESVFKRCLNVKDSGKLIPGRGGVLDSIDSIIIAAPIYYILVYFLF